MEKASLERINRIKENIKRQRMMSDRSQHTVADVKPKGFAEKVVLGWERPEVALQYTIFVKEVPQLKNDACYRKIEVDEEGFTVGVLPERIQISREHYDADRKYIESQGFSAEQHPEMRRYIP